EALGQRHEIAQVPELQGDSNDVPDRSGRLILSKFPTSPNWCQSQECPEPHLGKAVVSTFQETVMAQYDTQSLTQAVIERLGDCQDARFKQVMTSLVQHLHDFARDVD